MHTSHGLFDGVFGRGAVDTSDQAWLQAMLDTEAALARALEQAGMAAPGAGAAVTAAARAEAFDAADLGQQAALTGNPVPALVRALTRMLPPGPAGAVHQGATSQDIIDTAAMLLARQSLGVISDDLAAAAAAAARLAAAHRDTIMIGRTLLQQAVPVTFGLVAAGWLTGLDEAAAALDRVAASRLAVQFGGAAGTLSALGDRGPEVAALLAAELGLQAPTLPWHTDRLRITEIAGACAGAAGVLGKIARDVTLLAQSEVGEVIEGERAAGGADRPPCRTSGTRSPPSPSSAAPGRSPGCSPPWPPPRSRSTSGPPGPGTRSGSRWRTCSGSPARPPPGPRTCSPAWNPIRAGCGATSTRPAASRWPSTSRRCSRPRWAAPPPMTCWPGPAPRPWRRAGRWARRCWTAWTPASSAEAGVTPEQVAAALDPAGYLGAAAEFVDAALTAHARAAG